MKLGLRRVAVAVEPHDRQWEVAAQQTIAQLREILGDTAVDIQHIGSTSVRNICAKPIIDIAVGVRYFSDILEKNEILEKMASSSADRTSHNSISLSAEMRIPELTISTRSSMTPKRGTTT